MAQAGFTPIQLYFSTTAAAVPLAANLAQGELAINITDGKLYYENNSGTVTLLASAAGASGDVVGPSSATDNAVARFDGTTGKLIQNGVVIIGDTGAVTGVTDLTTTGNTILGDASTDTLNVGNGGLIKDASGNLGLGVTPSASVSKTIQIGGYSVFSDGAGGGGGPGVSGNAYEYSAGAYKYLATYSATLYRQNYFGTHEWFIAPSGTAGNVITFTQAMTLTAAGNLGIGTTNPVGRLGVVNTGDNSRISIGDTASSTYSTVLMYGGLGKYNFQLGVQNNVNNAFEITPSTATGGTTFSTPAFVLDSSGNVGIGTSSPAQTLHVKTSTAATPITLGVLSNSTTLPALSFNGAYASTTMAGTYSLSGSLYTTVPSGAAQYFSVADSIKLTLDSSGNLGLGVTPSAWYTSFGTKAFQFAASGSLQGLDVSSSDRRVSLANNDFINSSGNNIYINTGHATKYQQTAGQHQWFTAASGTAGNAITFTQAMTLDASGNLGIGTTTPSTKFNVVGSTSIADASVQIVQSGNYVCQLSLSNGYGNREGIVFRSDGSSSYTSFGIINTQTALTFATAAYNIGGTSDLSTGWTERARIDSSGNFMVGTTNADPVSNNVAGISLEGPFGSGKFSRSANPGLDVNRISNDGELVRFFQDGTQEGNISVSGTTVSYNGGHLSRYAQTTTSKDESLVKGTVLSNLDEMSVYIKDGQPVANEQLNKVKVSDVEGDANVAGVFVNWTHDDAHDVDEINMAMTGDMIIRIAQGTTVQRGDLLMSAGNGTAKPQGDDIVRSKTIAKVTSTHVTCTYADGSYCVPCVLMAC
jgi:hypothetical protein